MDGCKRNGIFPINYLKYKRATFEGNFTYHKNENRSQIDFALTNSTGRTNISSFKVVDQDWHMSDHRPIYLSVNIDCIASSNTLLVRAENLNYEFSPNIPVIRRYNKCYDLSVISYFIDNDTLHNDIFSAAQQRESCYLQM